ncbi:serine/threonine protein kinase [Nonomuraea fuscirosea]|uniref:serine/threonine-protein kinase n=1 Tax=Nonomuraea fuscirosea TaxID=1291556 RepID=UPI002DD7B43B|nr:serine/threonine-protein kinase [Nonomuraea fuscirosea]WSA52103.1 serine/threonine protein kinase [Nonomuraea fuscirosea]
MDGEPGSRFGARFRVAEETSVAEGRGRVLFAYDEELGRSVVLKRTDPAEARALAGLTHPHIVTVHDVLTVGEGSWAGTWLVLERMPNGSLSERTFAPREAARIGAQIADALAALHRKGLVHCDVKPANIVMDAEGTAKLTDFDAVWRIGGVETISPDRPISYTPDYAGPELVGGRPAAASDVFSLGATVYALVTGHPPRPWAHGGGSGAAARRADGGRSGAASHEADGGGSVDDARIVGRAAHHGVVEMAADVGPLRPVLAAMLRAEPERRPAAAGARDALRDVADPPPLWRKARDTAVRGWRALVARRWPVPAGAVAALALAGSATVWLTGSPATTAPLPLSASPSLSPSLSPPVSSPASPPVTQPVTRSGSPPASSPSAGSEARIVASKGARTTYGRSCRENCAFVEFLATGLKPGTEYHFQPYTSNWGAFNPGADLSADENGEQHSDDRFPCNATGQQVWIVAEAPDGHRIVSNKVTWTAG